MAKKTPIYLCTECGATSPMQTGKCATCGEFGTVKAWREPALEGGGSASVGGVDLLAAGAANKVDHTRLQRISTTIPELDRVAGGGMLPGALVLLGGSPGVGKSTLALQAAGAIAGAVYFTAEESVPQVMSRADRLGLPSLAGRVVCTQSLSDIAQTVIAHAPPLVVVDSIQLIGETTESLGSMRQLRINAEVLLSAAKQSGSVIVLIGHVTKSDQLAGPRALEHLVDVVLTLTGDRMSDLRILKSPKNRFGSTQEVGLFVMRGAGLVSVENPAELLLSERAEGAVGSCLTLVREGARVLPLEVQALCVKSHFGVPRRAATGLALNRLHVLLAVVEKFSPFGCAEHDVYLNVVGGLPLNDRAADAAIVAAVVSSRLGLPLPDTAVVLGEVGLTGEIRSVPALDQRIHEATTLGLPTVLSSKAGITSVSSLLRQLFPKKG